jgi:hypothetical protein
MVDDAARFDAASKSSCARFVSKGEMQLCTLPLRSALVVPSHRVSDPNRFPIAMTLQGLEDKRCQSFIIVVSHEPIK